MRQVVRSALVAFVLTRALFFGLTMFGSQLAFERKSFGNAVWETRVVLRASRVLPELGRMAMTGDAWFYWSIARDGYTHRPAAQAEGANWAFFPLYPLLVRYARVTGEFVLDGMLLSNLAFLGALILVGLVALQSGASAEDADRAVYYLACFPTSYFCSLPLPESLFLLLSAGAFAAAFGRRWAVAGVLGALAAATRFVGILLIPALLLLGMEWRTGNPACPPERTGRIACPPLRALWLLLIPLGTLAFMLHLRAVTGSPLAFMSVQSQWSRHATFFWSPLVDAVAQFPTLSIPWNFVAFHVAIAILLLVVAIAFALERRWSFAFYTLASLLVPLSTGTLQSLGRYSLVVFPLFLYLGKSGRRLLVDRVIVTVSLILFGWLVALFILRVDLAMA